MHTRTLFQNINVTMLLGRDMFFTLKHLLSAKVNIHTTDEVEMYDCFERDDTLQLVLLVLTQILYEYKWSVFRCLFFMLSDDIQRFAQ